VELKPAGKPAFLKLGFYGNTGTGKTWTAAKVLSQFIAEYLPDSQLAMFDTEPAAGYIAPMVKEITGKELLAVHSRSFPDLLDFAKTCKDKGYVALLDSATHPWRQLCADFLSAKRSRVKAVGGNPETTKLALSDWGPLKDIWNQFTEMYCFDPVHWCMCGREGDVWEMTQDEEGNEKMEKTGVKMKTETETGYEPSLLVQMVLRDNKHIARIKKDRFDALRAGDESTTDPDIEFFRPHLAMLDIGGAGPDVSVVPTFGHEQGANFETIRREREALLEEIKDDLVLALPGQDKDSKQQKVLALREAFGTSSWTKLEKNHNEFPAEVLRQGRSTLGVYLEKNNGKNGG